MKKIASLGGIEVILSAMKTFSDNERMLYGGCAALVNLSNLEGVWCLVFGVWCLVFGTESICVSYFVGCFPYTQEHRRIRDLHSCHISCLNILKIPFCLESY